MSDDTHAEMRLLNGNSLKRAGRETLILIAAAGGSCTARELAAMRGVCANAAGSMLAHMAAKGWLVRLGRQPRAVRGTVSRRTVFGLSGRAAALVDAMNGDSRPPVTANGHDVLEMLRSQSWPSVSGLARALGVTFQRAQQALAELEARGRIVRQRGTMQVQVVDE